MTLKRNTESKYNTTNISDNENEEVDNFPYIPKDLLERVQKDFDIRKMIWYSYERDTLMGIQQVVNYLEEHYNNQNNNNI